ncbi:MAG: PEP-utilizing enzyme, partial [bacterium]
LTQDAYLSILKKSAAIVTDAGGLLSHAAQAARELKKPCLVGTHIATQVLRDGDLIEVDATRGVVKILKRA